jgi:hypothetical protein
MKMKWIEQMNFIIRPERSVLWRWRGLREEGKGSVVEYI